MTKPKVVIVDHTFSNIDEQRDILESAGGEVIECQLQEPQEIIEASRGASVLMIQTAYITPEIIETLDTCKLMVRYGIGVDTIDVEAAKAKGIAVSNVPDYGIDEVADHAMALALCLARQIPFIDRRFRGGVWNMGPVTPMPALAEMTFATAGFGRIGRAVLERARAFKFRLACYDPFVSELDMSMSSVVKVELDELFSQSDILSLHMPLVESTHHLVNAERLAQMKVHAILLNTARGALIDTYALAEALNKRVIAAAGIDVFEVEPLENDHPLLACDNAMLTSHVAWCSQSSVPRLQRFAAEEAARCLRGEPLKNRVNK